MALEKQVVILYAAINGFVDDVAVDKVVDFEAVLHRFLEANHPEIGGAIVKEKEISADTEEKIKAALAEFKKSFAG